MEISGWIDELQSHGVALGEAAESAGPDAAVPTCPDWVVRDLVRHVGGVHRWAGDVVRNALTTFRDEPLEAIAGGWPDDIGLVEWFRHGHAALVDALRNAPDDLECQAFLPAASPLAFWARRQAHETAIHRFDADRAAGRATDYSSDFALDGLDELLLCFAARPSQRETVDRPRTFALHATDVDRDWYVTIAPDGVSVGIEQAPAELNVSGPGAALYPLMWNRRGPDGLGLDGDRELLEIWAETIRIRWAD